MTMPYYASPEQLMRDRSELARKGIARGRSVVVLTYAGGVLFVAENRSSALHKVSELYDRIGFAGVGKYNEFENLRARGIVHADVKGYTYDRADVTGRSLAKIYAQTLGAIFTEQLKPYEVEICVAEVGRPGEAREPQLYRITFDGSIVDEPEFIVMGGTAEPIAESLKKSFRPGLDLTAAVAIAVAALGAASPPNGPATAEATRILEVSSLEVAVLEQARPRRAFRRIRGTALEELLAAAAAPRSTSAAVEETADPEDPPVSDA